MYWIPAFFIFFEIIFFLSVDTIVRYDNIKILYQKYKNSELKNYSEKHFHGINVINSILAIGILAEFAYFIFGFFYPIWIISAIYFAQFLITTIISKLSGEPSIEKRIKLAKLKDFETSDIKFDRLLKLNELKSSEIKTHDWVKYIYPIIRIIIFASIIVLHYNYKII
jgi:uncharacterized ion transporter superfamily protein YfcC